MTRSSHSGRSVRASSRLVALAAATLTVLAGCTSTTADPQAVTVTTAPPAASTAASTPGSVVVVAPTPVGGDSSSDGSVVVGAPSTGGSASSDPAASNPGASNTAASSVTSAASSPASSSAASVTPSTPSAPVIKPVAVTTAPRNGAGAQDPLGRISVKATGGRIVWVRVLNPEGTAVAGAAKLNNLTWSATPELGYGRVYSVLVGTRNHQGHFASTKSTFTTVMPASRMSVSITPRTGQGVGVGQPVEFTFSQPVAGASRRYVESQIKVTSSSRQGGAFRWYSSTVLRWRPAGYWQRMAKVTVDADIYGKRLSPGVYGLADKVVKFTVSRKLESVVDAAAHTMKVYKDGALIRTIKVSLGNDKYPTPNGIYVVTQRLKTHVMDSSTWGLRGVGAYRTRVKYATRLSSGGIFVHGAPWSVAAQGSANVSHGCINMTDSAAAWYQASSLPGDTVKVINSKGPKLQLWDGFGDWNVPISKY